MFIFLKRITQQNKFKKIEWNDRDNFENIPEKLQQVKNGDFEICASFQIGSQD